MEVQTVTFTRTTKNGPGIILKYSHYLFIIQIGNMTIYLQIIEHGHSLNNKNYFNTYLKYP